MSVRLRPVFSGASTRTTVLGRREVDRVVVYAEDKGLENTKKRQPSFEVRCVIVDPNPLFTYWIRINDDAPEELSHAEVTTWDTTAPGLPQLFHMNIKSDEWTGTATGTRKMLIEEIEKEMDK